MIEESHNNIFVKLTAVENLATEHIIRVYSLSQYMGFSIKFAALISRTNKHSCRFR